MTTLFSGLRVLRGECSEFFLLAFDGVPLRRYMFASKNGCA